MTWRISSYSFSNCQSPSFNWNLCKSLNSLSCVISSIAYFLISKNLQDMGKIYLFQLYNLANHQQCWWPSGGYITKQLIILLKILLYIFWKLLFFEIAVMDLYIFLMTIKANINSTHCIDQWPNNSNTVSGIYTGLIIIITLNSIINKFKVCDSSQSSFASKIDYMRETAKNIN